jgi:hypothetical protein
MRWLIEKAALFLCWVSEKRGRVYYINGGPTQTTVYLVRFIPFKSKWCSLYIHRFMRSDADDPHDHPWNFLTYVISGGYTEVFYDRMKPEIKDGAFINLWLKTINRRKVGSIAHRNAHDIHQVVIDRPYELNELKQAPFTFCLIGPRFREWGFWKLEDNGGTFIDWRKYLGIRADDPKIVGSE